MATSKLPQHRRDSTPARESFTVKAIFAAIARLLEKKKILNHETPTLSESAVKEAYEKALLLYAEQMHFDPHGSSLYLKQIRVVHVLQQSLPQNKQTFSPAIALSDVIMKSLITDCKREHSEHKHLVSDLENIKAILDALEPTTGPRPQINTSMPTTI